MDTAALVGLDLEGGAALVDALTKAGLPIAVAAWLYLPNSRDWQLFIASPDTQTYGPLVVIRFVDEVREAIGSPLSYNAIRIANTTNHFINEVPVKAADLSSEPVRFRGTYLGDEDVDDGFIYLVNRKVKASKNEPKVTASVLRALRPKAA